MLEKIEQLMKENKLYGEAYDSYVAKNVVKVEISGDWKHEHLRLKLLVMDNLPVKYHREYVIEEDGGDWYTAIHEFHF